MRLRDGRPDVDRDAFRTGTNHLRRKSFRQARHNELCAVNDISPVRCLPDFDKRIVQEGTNLLDCKHIVIDELL
jgi:hypothetical protein